MHLRQLALAGLAACLLLSSAPATQQGTTGAPCLNDYCLGPFVSGATSCQPLSLPGGGPISLNIHTAAENLPVFFFFSGPNPCTAGALCLPASSAPLPFSACGGTTNQSIDILPSVVAPFTCTTGPDAFAPGCGFCEVFVDLPPGIGFSTQAVILDPVNGVPFGAGGLKVLLTQAYQVTT